MMVTRGQVGGYMGGIKGIKSTLTMMTTEQYIELLNHYTIYLKVI